MFRLLVRSNLRAAVVKPIANPIGKSIVYPSSLCLPSLTRTIVSRAAKTVVKNQNKEIGNSTGTTNTSTAQTPPLTDLQKLQLMESHPAVKLFPKFMRKYAVRFVNAPISHVTSFLIIHEVSAIGPLFAIWALLHHYNFVPPGLPDWLVSNGINFIKALAERNQWDDITTAANTSKIILEGAAAYSIVKLLLPFRIALSLALMPWFARVFVLPISNLLSRFWPKKKGPKKEEDEEVLNKELKDEIKKKEIGNDNRPRL